MTQGRQMIEEVLPVHDIGVRVQVPPGRTVRRAYLAPEMQDVPFSMENGYAVLRVPRVHIHTMVVLDLN
jgi:hypothetical protein